MGDSTAPVLAAISQVLLDERGRVDGLLAAVQEDRESAVAAAHSKAEERLEELRDALSGQLEEIRESISHRLAATVQDLRFQVREVSETSEKRWTEVGAELSCAVAGFQEKAATLSAERHGDVLDVVEALETLKGEWEVYQSEVLKALKRSDTEYERSLLHLANASARLNSAQEQLHSTLEALDERLRRAETNAQILRSDIKESLSKLVDKGTVKLTQDRLLAAVRDHDSLVTRVNLEADAAESRLLGVKGEIDQTLGEFKAALDARHRQTGERIASIADDYQARTGVLSGEIERVERDLEEHRVDLGREVDRVEREFAEAIVALRTGADETGVRVNDLNERLGRVFDELQESLHSNARDAASLVEEVDGRLNETQIEVTSVRDSVEAVRDKLAQSSGELRDRIDERHESAQSRIDDLVESFARTAEAHEGRLELTEDQSRQLREEIERTRTEAAETAGHIREEIDGALDAVQGELKEAIVENLDRWPTVPQFSLGGPPCKKDTLVSYRGGLWQARELTGEEPGMGDAWECMVSGVADVRIENAKEERGTLDLVVRPTVGAERRFELQLPMPRMRGTWRKNTPYRFNDSVIDDAQRWRAKKDDPEGPPHKFPRQWVLETPRAPRGLKGEKGDKGDKGDRYSEKEMLATWVDFLENDGAVSITSYRGIWKYGETYRRTQAVTFATGLYLCREDHRAEMPPNTPGMIDKWVPLVFLEPEGRAVRWDEVLDKPEQFPPEAHDHLEAHIIDLDRVRLKGDYDPQESYVKNDWVLDSGWGAVALTATQERPAPTPSGQATWNLPDVPTWDSPTPSHVGLVYTAHEYTFLEPGWIKQIQVWVPELTADTNYRFTILNTTDPDNPTAFTLEEPVLNEAGWTTIFLRNEAVAAGTKLLVLIDALNSGSSSGVTGGWSRDVNSAGAAPAAQSWNRNNGETILRIDKTDLDSSDRAVELLGIIAGSTIQFVSTLDVSASVTYFVNGPPIDQGSYVEYSVALDATGPGGQPDIGAVTTMTADIPVPQDTQYAEIQGGQAANQPAWATVVGAKQYDGVPRAGADAHVYGIRMSFQPAYLSPDWKIMHYSEGASGGGGGSGGGHIIQDEGVDLLQRDRLNFTGNGVTVEDDPATGGTKVIVAGGTAGVVDWGDISGKPTTFPPDMHVHQNFTGAGTAGFVPDPAIESDAVLRDDGVWTDVLDAGTF